MAGKTEQFQKKILKLLKTKDLCLTIPIIQLMMKQ